MEEEALKILEEKLKPILVGLYEEDESGETSTTFLYGFLEGVEALNKDLAWTIRDLIVLEAEAPSGSEDDLFYPM